MKLFNLLYLNLSLVIFLLAFFSCGSTKIALRNHDDLKWAKNNYYSNTFKLFQDVFFLDNRDLHNASVYYLGELYYDLKVIPLSLQEGKSAKKYSEKQLEKSLENKKVKANIVSFLKKRFSLEKDFNVKNIILKTIASLGDEEYWFDDRSWRKKEIGINAIFIAKAVEEDNILIAHYAITLLADKPQLLKYQIISLEDKQKIINMVQKYYQETKDTITPVLANRIYKIINNFDKEHFLLDDIFKRFEFLASLQSANKSN